MSLKIFSITEDQKQELEILVTQLADFLHKNEIPYLFNAVIGYDGEDLQSVASANIDGAKGIAPRTLIAAYVTLNGVLPQPMVDMIAAQIDTDAKCQCERCKAQSKH